MGEWGTRIGKRKDERDGSKVEEKGKNKKESREAEVFLGIRASLWGRKRKRHGRCGDPLNSRVGDPAPRDPVDFPFPHLGPDHLLPSPLSSSHANPSSYGDPNIAPSQSSLITSWVHF